MFCPYYKNKDVFDGFNNIIQALGGKPMTEEEFRSAELRNQRSGLDYSAMEAAYKAYHANNGNLMDLAPNGQPSLVFQQLLQIYNGDINKAIKAKTNLYSKTFRKHFGDWLSDSISKDKIDINGEPILPSESHQKKQKTLLHLGQRLVYKTNLRELMYILLLANLYQVLYRVAKNSLVKILFPDFHS